MSFKVQQLKLSFHGRWLLLLTVGAIAISLVNLGNMPLRDWDEAHYAMVSRELTQTNSWIYLLFRDQPYLIKPPLIYWLVASSYQLFGEITEFTSRLPTALISSLCVPLLYGVAKELKSNQWYAIFSSATYLTLLAVARHGRLLMFDGTVNTLYVLAILCLLKAEKSHLWSIGLGLSLASISLIKGALVFPLGGIILAFIILDNRGQIFKNLYAWTGVLVGFGCSFGWHFLQWQEYGDLFVQQYLGFQNFARVTTTIEGNDGPPWYYILEIVKYSVPWLFFLPGGLLLAWQYRRESLGKLILLGAIGFLVIVSAMGTKLPWYIMPFYPFFCLAVGLNLERINDHFKRSDTRLWGVFAAIAGLCFLGIFYLAASDPQFLLILMGLSLTVTMGMTAWYLKKQDKKFIISLFFGTYISLFFLMMSQAWVWEINEAFPVKPIAAIIRTETPEDAVIFTTFDYSRPSLDFYGDRPVRPQTLEAPVGDQYWLIHQDLLTEQPALKEELPPFELLGRASGFNLVHFFPD